MPLQFILLIDQKIEIGYIWPEMWEAVKHNSSPFTLFPKILWQEDEKNACVAISKLSSNPDSTSDNDIGISLGWQINP